MKLKKIEKYNNVFSYETKKGTLYAFRYLFYDSFGKRHEKQQRGFLTALLAHKAELKVEMLVAENESQLLQDSDLTFRQWASKFIEMKKSGWRPSYLEQFRGCVRKYINPLIGDKKLTKINKMEYDYLYIQPQRKMKMSPATLKTHHRFVMILLNAALANDLIPRNKLSGIKIDFGRQKRRKAFSEKDLAKFNDQLEKEPLWKQIFFLTLELTGMRKGEALALTWDDIDLKKNIIHITKSRDKFGVGPTKTPAGVRDVAISESLSTRLKKFKLQWTPNSLRKNHDKPNKFVFVGVYNDAMSWNTSDFYFKKIMKEIGVKEGTYVIHSLRHTQATLLIANGVSPTEVAHRLGHANATVTLDVYTHPTSSHDADNAEKFSDIVNL